MKELEIKKLEFEKDKLLKWIGFLQTIFLLTASATVSLLYHKQEIDFWRFLGIGTSVVFFAEVLFNYRKLNNLKKKIDELGEE